MEPATPTPTSTPITTVRHPHLQGLVQDVEAIIATTTAWQRDLSPAQLTWTPEAGRWSIAACLDHLCITNEDYFERLQKAIDAGDATQATAPYRPGFIARKFIDFVRPDPTRKLKAPGPFQPSSDPTYDLSILSRYLDVQRQMLDLIRQADAVNINGVKLASPIMRLLRFTVGEALTMLVRHEQRHMQQAQRLIDHDAFPAA